MALDTTKPILKTTEIGHMSPMVPPMIVRVFGDGILTDVPVTPETTSSDVIECCRDPGDESCELVATCPDHGERLLQESEHPLEILQRWGSGRLFLRYTVLSSDGKSMQKKWKSLKDSFNRELRRQKTVKSGDSAAVRKTYTYFKKLLFLLPNSESRETATNVSAVITETPETSGHSDNSQTQTTSRSHMKKKRKANFEEELLSILQSKKSAVHTDENDGDRMFLLSFLNDMKNLPLQRKNWVKLQFMQAMSQASLDLDVVHVSPTFNPGPSLINRPLSTQTSQCMQPNGTLATGSHYNIWNTRASTSIPRDETGISPQDFVTPSPASSTQDSETFDIYENV